MTLNNRSNRSFSGPIDPDPFTIFLATLGAVGSIASVYSAVTQIRDKRINHSRRIHRRKVHDIVLKLEYELNRLLRDSALVSEQVKPRIGQSPFRFGGELVFRDLEQFDEYAQLADSILVSGRTIHKLIISLIYELYSLPEDWNSTPLADLIRLREQCNKILYGGLPFEEGAYLINKLLHETVKTVRGIREWLMEM